MPIFLIVRRREHWGSWNDQRIKFTYPRFNATIRCVITKKCPQNLGDKNRDGEQENITDEAPPKKNKIE